MVLIGILFYTNCTQMAGTSDETTTGVKFANVVYSNGKPASEAVVKVLVSGDTSRIPVAQLSTDANGTFTFKNDKGFYSFYVQKDSLMAFEDSVLLLPVGSDTSTLVLCNPGSINGYISVEPGDNPRTVFVGVLGTTIYSNIEENGKFELPEIAAGVYTLRFISTLPEYTPTFKTLRVYSDSTMTLDTIRMVYTGIPSVKGIQAEIDPITGNIMIKWNKSKYFNLDEYIIYRNLASNPYSQKASIGMAADTFFVDSSAVELLQGQGSVSVRYYIAILDKKGGIGNSLAYYQINVVSPKSLLNTITPSELEHFDPGQSVTFKWNSVHGATKYQLFISTDITFSDTIQISSHTDTSAVVASLSTGAYFWKIRCQSSSSVWGPWSKINQFGSGILTKNLCTLKSNESVSVWGISEGAVAVYSIYDDTHIRVCKYDSVGTKLWEKIINTETPQTTVTAANIQQISDGFLIQTGTRTSGTSPFNSGTLIKIDDNGSEIWRHTVRGDINNVTLSSDKKMIGLAAIDNYGNSVSRYELILDKDNTTVFENSVPDTNNNGELIFPQNEKGATIILHNRNKSRITIQKLSSDSYTIVDSTVIESPSNHYLAGGWNNKDGSVTFFTSYISAALEFSQYYKNDASTVVPIKTMFGYPTGNTEDMTLEVDGRDPTTPTLYLSIYKGGQSYTTPLTISKECVNSIAPTFQNNNSIILLLTTKSNQVYFIKYPVTSKPMIPMCLPE